MRELLSQLDQRLEYLFQSTDLEASHVLRLRKASAFRMLPVLVNRVQEEDSGKSHFGAKQNELVAWIETLERIADQYLSVLEANDA
jgi:hypothetical protein